MMELVEIVDLITSNSMSIAIIGYFLYKDYKFNATITNVLNEVKDVLSRLCILIGRE